MRLLYDTNALVGLVRPEEFERLKKQITAQTTIIVSTEILLELEVTLVKKLHFTKQKAKTIIRHVAKVSTTVIPQGIERICRDPADDHILAAAITGKADYLITSDQDLLVLGSYQGVKIITPAAFNQLML